jgi:hypothetical protein
MALRRVLPEIARRCLDNAAGLVHDESTRRRQFGARRPQSRYRSTRPEEGCMTMRWHVAQRVLVPLALCLAAGFAPVGSAAEIGQIKVAKGAVSVERAGAVQPGTVGLRLQAADVVKTGPDGSVGITMSDNSLLSAGPNSILSLERFEFDATTGQGRFDSALRTGSLAVVSGRIARQSPSAMTVRTPQAILGVRGTEFAVNAHEPVPAGR